MVADIHSLERAVDKASRRIVTTLRGQAESGKLSPLERSQVAHRLKRGESATVLAREYGISRSRVYQIGRGR